jgi:hypothetical protein
MRVPAMSFRRGWLPREESRMLFRRKRTQLFVQKNARLEKPLAAYRSRRYTRFWRGYLMMYT